MECGILQKLSQELTDESTGSPTVLDNPRNRGDSPDVPLKRDNSQAHSSNNSATELIELKKGQEQKVLLMRELMDSFKSLKSDADRLYEQADDNRGSDD